MQKGVFLAVRNAFATLFRHCINEKVAKKAKMVSWQIQNDIIGSLSQFVWSG